MSGIMLGAIGASGGNDPVATIYLEPSVVYDVTVFPSGASAYFRLDNDGYAYQDLSSGSTQLFQWCNPAASAALYQAFVTVVYGTLVPGSATSSWLSLGSDRTWGLPLATVGSNAAQISVAISAITDPSTILAQESVDIYADVL